MYNKSGRRYLREINLIFFLKMKFIIAELQMGAETNLDHYQL